MDNLIKEILEVIKKHEIMGNDRYIIGRMETGKLQEDGTIFLELRLDKDCTK